MSGKDDTANDTKDVKTDEKEVRRAQVVDRKLIFQGLLEMVENLVSESGMDPVTKAVQVAKIDAVQALIDELPG